MLIIEEKNLHDNKNKSNWIFNLNEEETSFNENELTEFELMFCEKCFQMTNHINGVCQKCKN